MPQTAPIPAGAAVDPNAVPIPQRAASSQPSFDVDGARAAGYSDDEILQHLTQSRRFDVAGAMKVGYSKQDIIQHLISTPAPPSSTLLSPDDFAGKIKAKYPEYAGMDNLELTKRIVAKYPEYAGKVNLGAGAGANAFQPVMKNGIPTVLGTAEPAGPGLAGLSPEENLAHLHDTDPIAQSPGVRADMAATGDLSKPGFVPGVIGKLIGASGPESNTVHRLAAATSPQETSAIMAENQKHLDATPIPEQIAEAIPGLGGHVLTGAKAVRSFRKGNASEGLGYAGATLLPLVGPIAASTGENFGQGDVKEGLENLATLAVPEALSHVIPNASGSTSMKAPLARDASMNSLTRAVNPAASDLGYVNANGGGAGFQGNLSDIHDILADHAQTTGLPTKLAKAKAPSEAVNAVADTARDAAQNLPIFKQAIEPLANEPITLWGGATTTFGKLNNRLTAINGELYPAYQRGGAGSAAAGAATNAERVQALQGEAAQIRDIMNDFIAKKTGLPADQVADLRGQYGKLKDIADTAQFRANEMQAAENTAANKQTTLGDLVPSLAKPLGGVQLAASKIPLQKNPVIAGLRQAFTYKGAPPQALNILPPVPPRPRVPLWKQGQAPSSPAPSSPAAPVVTPVPDLISRVVNGKSGTYAADPRTGEQILAQAAERRNAAANAVNATVESRAASQPSDLPEVIQEITSSGHPPTGGAASLEELARGTQHWIVDTRNGKLTYLGVSPDAGASGLRPGSAIVSVTKDGQMNVVNNNSGLSDSQVLMQTTPTFRREFPERFQKGAPAAPKPPREISSLLPDESPRIDVIHPSGVAGTVPAHQLPDALSQGYRLANPLA